jgi:hypothetical protein
MQKTEAWSNSAKTIFLAAFAILREKKPFLE